MVVVGGPGELDGFGDHVFADLVVDVGFVGLAELEAAGDAVHLAVLEEEGTGLMEVRVFPHFLPRIPG